MDQEKIYAKKISEYANKWVALVDHDVVASGKTLKEVQEEVTKKGIKNYVFHLVAPPSISLAP